MRCRSTALAAPWMWCGLVAPTTEMCIRDRLNPGHFNWEEPGMEYMAQWLPQVIDNAVPVTFVQAGNQFTWLDYKNKK